MGPAIVGVSYWLTETLAQYSNILHFHNRCRFYKSRPGVDVYRTTVLLAYIAKFVNSIHCEIVYYMK